MKLRAALIGNLVFLAVPLTAVEAEPARFCVKCVDPNQTYVCQVETPLSGAPTSGLRLYCIVRTSKEGGHRSCAVDNTPISSCVGPLKSYALVPPRTSPETRATIERFRGQPNNEASFANDPPPAGGGTEPLAGVTRGAPGASQDGLRPDGETEGGVASRTGQSVGNAARKVGKAAGKVGSATKKTGNAVGNAAKSAYDCVRSLFKECGSSREAQ